MIVKEAWGKLAPHNLELVTTVFALKTWSHHLYDEQCEVFTDHKSLKYIFTQKDLNMRQRIWLEMLKGYYLTLNYHLKEVELGSICLHNWCALGKYDSPVNTCRLHQIEAAWRLRFTNDRNTGQLWSKKGFCNSCWRILWRDCVYLMTRN